MTPRLHIFGLPHTVTNQAHSHCAFTGKVLRFPGMMRAQGYEVIHYGVAGSEADATENVSLMEQDEHLQLIGLTAYNERPSAFHGDDAHEDHPAYRQFNHYLFDELEARLEPGDICCLPFSSCHDRAVTRQRLVESGEVAVIESGIGYMNPRHLLRVYESEAVRHFIMGHEHRAGVTFNAARREWVVPNYYDVSAWQLGAQRDLNAVAMFGRITESKGADLVGRLATQRPDLRFILCGQGDPSPFLTAPNVEYWKPLYGTDRAKLLGNVRAVLAPSRYLEPFCGTAVEAQLCGTPVIVSDFGAFTETVIEGVTGFRCGPERAFAEALDKVLRLSPHQIRERARARYGLAAVGKMYRHVFEEVSERLAATRRANAETN